MIMKPYGRGNSSGAFEEMHTVKKDISELQNTGVDTTARADIAELTSQLADVADAAAASALELAAVKSQRVSENLYNHTDADVALNYYIVGNDLTSNVNSIVSGYIPVTVGQKYIIPIPAYTLGLTNSKKVSVYGAEKDYLAVLATSLWAFKRDGTGSPVDVTATFNSTTYPIAEYTICAVVEITNASARYMRVNLPAKNGYNFYGSAAVVFSGDETDLPIHFKPYYAPYPELANIAIPYANMQYLNPLHGKTAVFTGDSICHGGSASDGLGGYAGRIGRLNNMTWANIGVSGGTVAYVDEAHFCISRSIPAMYAIQPNADYIILEGGTNDADNFLTGNGGSLSSGYAAVLDDTVFAEAMEKMLKTAIETYPGKKIGYIVAHKMGNPPKAVRKEFFDIAISACVKWGVPYLNLWDGCHLNSQIAALSAMYSDASQHLTTAGYDYIAPIIQAWMRTL